MHDIATEASAAGAGRRAAASRLPAGQAGLLARTEMAPLFTETYAPRRLPLCVVRRRDRRSAVACPGAAAPPRPTGSSADRASDRKNSAGVGRGDTTMRRHCDWELILGFKFCRRSFLCIFERSRGHSGFGLPVTVTAAGS